MQTIPLMERDRVLAMCDAPSRTHVAAMWVKFAVQGYNERPYGRHIVRCFLHPFQKALDHAFGRRGSLETSYCVYNTYVVLPQYFWRYLLQFAAGGLNHHANVYQGRLTHVSIPPAYVPCATVPEGTTDMQWEKKDVFQER